MDEREKEEGVRRRVDGSKDSNKWQSDDSSLGGERERERAEQSQRNQVGSTMREDL